MSQPQTIHEDDPRPGYYAYRRHREAAWEPVAIWLTSFSQGDTPKGTLVCKIGFGEGARMVDPLEYWTFLAGNKRDKADVMAAFKTGRWPGDVPPREGDNLPPTGDPFEDLTREVEAEAARARAWISEPHEGTTAANMAANWLDALRKMEKRVLETFTKEKAPALAEATRIDVKWRGLKALAEDIKKAMDTTYQEIGRREKKRLQEAADAKARVEAEKKRQEWEANQAKQVELAKHHGIPIEPEPMPLFPVVTEAPPVKVAFGGAQGSRVGIRKKPATAYINNWVKAATHYSGNPKLREVIQKLADHDARDGHPFDGMEIVSGE